MTAVRRYLLGGGVATVGCILLPLGIGRDALYCLIGASGAAAILVGVRRNRPDRPHAWHLIGAGTAVWVAADALYAWYEHVELIDPFPSLADVFYLAVYPLFGAGLLLLARNRGTERQLAALDDTAILTLALGLLSWVFLIEPTWAAGGDILSRAVGVAYPVCDVLLFAMVVRLATTAGGWTTAHRLVMASIGALLVSDIVFGAGAFLPFLADHAYLTDAGYLASYVLMGAGALHPSMSAPGAPASRGTPRTSRGRLTRLAAAVMVGPTLLAYELVAAAPMHVGPVVIESVAMVVLVLTRVRWLVTQLEDQAERLERLADIDYVTNLASRRRFIDRLGELLADPRRPVAGLLLIDLERFSEVNDNLGHRTGDAILHAVGVRLGELTGPHALVARMGSDTFGVLDPAITTGEQAYREAVRIRAALELPLDLPDLSVSVEVSIGALVLPEDGPEPTSALLRADVALSVARARDERTARYGVEMESGGMLAPLLIGELREAIEHGDLVVHYQPQVEVATGHVFGVEALVRWQHPIHGLLGPDTFISAAEQTGLIGPLTAYVLDHALLACARWHSEGLDLTVAVNLSVRNLLDPGLVDDVREALMRHGLDAASLELEITEGTAMVDPRRSTQVLGAFTQMGVSLSIDDFGTGQSSLAYLHRLPVRRLKIDRSFVTGMVDDDNSAAIVRSTIELARALRLDVVAEGIEDDATLLMLRDMQCFAAQGFGLGRPVAGPLLPELVRRIEERLPAILATHVLSDALPT